MPYIACGVGSHEYLTTHGPTKHTKHRMAPLCLVKYLRALDSTANSRTTPHVNCMSTARARKPLAKRQKQNKKNSASNLFNKTHPESQSPVTPAFSASLYTALGVTRSDEHGPSIASTVKKLRFTPSLCLYGTLHVMWQAKHAAALL
jgi:hypothetical protein